MSLVVLGEVSAVKLEQDLSPYRFNAQPISVPVGEHSHQIEYSLSGGRVRGGGMNREGNAPERRVEGEHGGDEGVLNQRASRLPRSQRHAPPLRGVHTCESYRPCRTRQTK